MTSADQLVEDLLVEAARRDPVAFNDYVLKDERDGGPIASCPMQQEWHGLADQHSRLEILSHIESGKTVQLGVGRVMWELGNNPDLRIAIACNTSGQASKIVSTIGHYIEHSAELHKVFPHLRRDPNGPWNLSALSVLRSAPSRDPSVQACGVHGNILGARIDLAILDDLCDFENSRTPALRDDLDRWLRSTLLGRLTERSRAWMTGNVWHRDDQHARFEQSGWATFRFPIVDDAGQPRWPAQWSPERIADKRRDLGPREAARQLDCIPPDDADPIFLPEWIDAALRSGEGASSELLASATSPGDVAVLGIDPAFSKNERADSSALVLCRAQRGGRREVTMVQTGRWTLDELVSNAEHRCRVSRAVAAVESNAGGEYACQELERRAVPIVRMHTSAATKRARVEMLVSELAQGRWSFRQPGFLDPEMRRLAQGLMAFSYEEHTDDRVAALLVAVEAIRTREHRPKAGWRSLNLHVR